VSGAEPGCGPTLASNDAARPTLGVATTGGVARAGHDRTQRRARSLTIDVVGGAGVNCLLVFSFRGITSVARQRFSSEKTRWALLPVTGQALIAVFSSLLAILMRRGLAFSATGMANRSTPSW